MKKVENPRKKLRELSKKVQRIAATPFSNFTDEPLTLAKAVLKFLKYEPVTLVISSDRYETLATAHPSPKYARLEIISCMLDGFENYFDREEDGAHFLELVQNGKFKAAIDFWNAESREQGSNGDFYDMHNGKVEKNYTVRDLKARAKAMKESPNEC